VAAAENPLDQRVLGWIGLGHGSAVGTGGRRAGRLGAGAR
jgi:hypothetical protein